MQSKISKPLLIYDGDCEFCRYWISRWQHVTKDRIDYAPYQQVATEFPEIPLSAFQTSVKLILENGEVFSGSEAVLRALNNRLLLWCYYSLPGYAPLSEAVYRFVARHRPFFSKVTRWLWRTHSE
jgi:predicted DCC family thiol-disulfide oxidoreductase YuxK